MKQDLFKHFRLLLITICMLGLSVSAWAGKGFYGDGMWNIKYYDGSDVTTSYYGSSATMKLGVKTKLYFKGGKVKTWSNDSWTQNNVNFKYTINGNSENYTVYKDNVQGDQTWEYTGWDANLIDKAANNPGENTVTMEYWLDSYCKANGYFTFTIPGFTTTSTSQDYGSVTVGSDKSIEISFGTHYGTALETSNCVLSGDNKSEFSVTSISESKVTVKFAPTSVGSNKSATLTITDAHSKKCTITLEGTGTCATPSASNFNFTNTSVTYNGSEQAPTISTKDATTVGAVTKVYYDGATATGKTDAGTYAITIDSDGGTKYCAASKLSLGNFVINSKEPAASDFDVSGLTPTYDGTAKAVTVTVKSGISGMGSVSTIYYEGTSYPKSKTAPTDAGDYAVTFDVAEGTNYASASGLSAGTLEINKAQRTISITNTTTTFCQSEKPTVTTQVSAGASDGTITFSIETGETGGTGTATIDQSGVITCTAPGTVVAKVYITGGTNYYASEPVTKTFTFDATSAAGTITGAGAICSGTGTTLGISGNTGSTYQWQKSTDGSSYSDISGAQSETYETGNLTATTYYKVKVKNGTCGYATSDAATVSINGTPTVEDISGAASMYLGDTKTYSTSVTAATGTTISSKVWAMTPPTDVTALQGESSSESINLTAIANTIGTGHEVKFTATDNCGSSVSKTKTVDVAAIPAPATCGISINRSTSRSGSGTSSDPYILFDGDTFTFTLNATHGVSDQFEGFGWNVNSSSSPTQFTNTGISQWTSGQYNASDLTVGTAVAYTGYAWSYNTNTSYYSSTAKESDAIYVKHIQGPANLYLRGPIYEKDNNGGWPGTSASNYHQFTKNGNTYTLTFNPDCNYCQDGSKEFVISTDQSGTCLQTSYFSDRMTNCQASSRSGQSTYNFESTLSYLNTDQLTVTITWNGENNYSIAMTKSLTAPTDLYIKGPLAHWGWYDYTNENVGYVHSGNTYSFTFNARNTGQYDQHRQFCISSSSSSDGGKIHLGTIGSGQGWSFVDNTEGKNFVASSDIVDADNKPITISLVYNTTTGLFDMTLASACNDPSSGFTQVSAVYNGGDAVWSTTFADEQRSAVLSTTLTSLIYQWVLCDADGNNEVTSPTVADNHVTLSNANTASCTATFDLPGTYYFKLKAGCSSASISSTVLTVNVPYPSMGIQGLGINGSWNCCYAAGDGLMTRSGLTWTKTYTAPATSGYASPNGEFLVMQQYKRSKDGSSSCAGWDGAYEVCGGDFNCGNTVNSATGDGTLNLTGLSINSDNYHNMYSTIGLSAGEEARVTVVMTGYNSYNVTLSKTCITPTVANFTYDCTTKTYNTSAQPVNVTWNGTEGGAITVYYKSGDGEYSTTAPTNAGTYSVAVSTAAGGGYCAVNQLVLCNNYTIAKASRTITTGVSAEWACKDGTITLSSNTTAPTDGTISYAIVGGTGTGSIDGNILTCTGEGTIQVKASITEGSNYLAATSESYAEVTVRPIPESGTIAASPASPICSGTYTTLTLSGVSGYATLQWYKGSEVLSGEQSATYQTENLTAATTYSVLVTLDGCTSQDNAITIAIKPAALSIEASTSTVNPYTAVTLTAKNNSSVATNADWTVTGTGSYLENTSHVPYTTDPSGVSSVILKPAASVETEVTATATVDECEVSDTYSVTPTADSQSCQ